MRSRIRLALAVLALVAGPAALARADVKLPSLLSDHMVLQRDAEVPLWGTAAAGEEVTVKFRDQTKSATADKDGKWSLKLSALKAGGPDELTFSGKNTIVVNDVLVGEIWVGSGQSNMAGNVGGYAPNDKVLAEMAATAHPNIRHVTANGKWLVATLENNPKFSAILFAFGVRLNEKLEVPVGLMLGAVGGTPSGSWLSEEAFRADKAAVALHDQYPPQYEKLLNTYNTVQVPAWEKQLAEDKAAGKKLPNKPRAPTPPTRRTVRRSATSTRPISSRSSPTQSMACSGTKAKAARRSATSTNTP